MLIYHRNYIWEVVLKTLFLLISALFFTGSLLAVDHLTTQSDGTHIYECESPGYTGKKRIKQIGKGLYRSLNGARAGVYQANSAKDAAEIACGEEPLPKKQ